MIYRELYLSQESTAGCCSMLQYVAVCCSMLQYVAACCSMLQYVAVCWLYRRDVWKQGYTLPKNDLCLKMSKNKVF